LPLFWQKRSNACGDQAPDLGAFCASAAGVLLLALGGFGYFIPAKSAGQVTPT
jgi:hypothetical protein